MPLHVRMLRGKGLLKVSCVQTQFPQRSKVPMNPLDHTSCNHVFCAIFFSNELIREKSLFPKGSLKKHTIY